MATGQFASKVLQEAILRLQPQCCASSDDLFLLLVAEAKFELHSTPIGPPSSESITLRRERLLGDGDRRRRGNWLSKPVAMNSAFAATGLRLGRCLFVCSRITANPTE